MGAAKHGNPLVLLALLLLGALMVLDGGAHAWRDGSSEGPQLGRHLLADVAIGYCGGAPFSLLNTTGKGTCAFPGVFGGCDGGGCWCSKNLDPSYNPCDALPQGSGPWTWCSAESQAVGECAQAGACNLWFKQEPLGVVNFFAKAGCAAEDAISASANNNYKFGLVVAHGGGGGCGYSQLRPGSEGLYSFVVGKNKNLELQGLSNLNVCYTMTPSACQCTGGTDPNNWSQGAPAYLCPGSPFKYTGGGALLRDSCGNDVDVRYFILQRKVGTSDWVNVADIPYPAVALENPELYAACGTYRLAATVCGNTFYRTILVREIDVNTYNDPIIPQGGKTYCPGAAVNAADLFTSLTAKVLGSGEPGIACSFAPTVAAATYPDSCTSGGSITATFSVCPATTSPVASAGSGETRQVTVTTYEPLVPSPGWAAVTEAAPFGFVGFQCPDPHATLGTLTLSSSCPGRPDTVPVITPGGQVDADGCGTLTGTATQCGQTFGRKVVQDVESLNKPVVGPPDTQCPGYLTPNDFLPLTTTANMVGAPPDAPKCTAQGLPIALPPAPDSCGSISYTRTYSLCGKQVTSDPRVLITDALMSDGGWSANTDYLCPYERLNLTPVTLTSNCPSWTIPGNPFVPVMDGPGFPWNGCGAVRFKVSFCGETFTKNYVRGAAVTTAPSLHTICPNAPPPNPLFIPGYTSVTVPGSNPPKPCFLLPTPVRPAPMPQATCGTTTYSRKYLFCGTAVREDAVVTVNEVFGGFDPACPFKYITSCPTPNCVKLATLVGQPEVAGGCVFTETVKATVCGVDHVEKYTFSSCQVADA